MALVSNIPNLGKKGVFFTFVASIFLSLLIFSSLVGNNYDLREHTFVIETRVATTNMFISGVEKDIERAAYIAGFRSLVGLVDNIISTGEYEADVESRFEELFFNGTIDGTESLVMENNTFNHWSSEIQEEAEKINLDSDFEISNFTVLQDDPWNIRIDLDLYMVVKDIQNISSWTRKSNITTYISLEGFEDPSYPLETNGLAENRIRKTNLSYFVSGTDISNLLNHTYEGYYIEFSGAPSFLNRLKGNFSSSKYGIESLVDIDDLISKGISVDDKTIVDHIYFSEDDPTSYHVSGAPSWFKLDNETNKYGNYTHLELYEAEDLI